MKQPSPGYQIIDKCVGMSQDGGAEIDCGYCWKYTETACE